MESGKVTSSLSVFLLVVCFLLFNQKCTACFYPFTLPSIFFQPYHQLLGETPPGTWLCSPMCSLPEPSPSPREGQCSSPPRLQMRKRSCTEIPAHSYTQQLQIQTQARLTPESWQSPHHRVWGGCALLGGAESNLPSGSHKKGEVANGSANTWHFLPLICMLSAAGWPRQHGGPCAEPEATKPDASAKSCEVLCSVLLVTMGAMQGTASEPLSSSLAESKGRGLTPAGGSYLKKEGRLSPQ